jgi:hypothetical protein
MGAALNFSFGLSLETGSLRGSLQFHLGERCVDGEKGVKKQQFDGDFHGKINNFMEI